MSSVGARLSRDNPILATRLNQFFLRRASKINGLEIVCNVGWRVESLVRVSDVAHGLVAGDWIEGA